MRPQRAKGSTLGDIPVVAADEHHGALQCGSKVERRVRVTLAGRPVAKVAHHRASCALEAIPSGVTGMWPRGRE